jgi:tRNA threonylcarbamoyladenosine biosynthesis protein TsaB
MLLLAVDTSGKHGSIALARCEPDGSCEAIDVIPLAGGTFSAQLVPQIAALLIAHGFTKQDVGAFAVASGPGSFTGLRIGLAAIKGLAEVLGKPIAAVSLLEVIAAAGGSHGKILAALDAGRSEVYVGEYEVSAESARMISERLITQDELMESAAGLTVVTPDPHIAEALRSEKIHVKTIDRPGAYAIARLGWQKIHAGDTVPAEQLEANYIRRTDAELFSKPAVR